MCSSWSGAGPGGRSTASLSPELPFPRKFAFWASRPTNVFQSTDYLMAIAQARNRREGPGHRWELMVQLEVPEGAGAGPTWRRVLRS